MKRLTEWLEELGVLGAVVAAMVSIAGLIVLAIVDGVI